MTSGQASGIPTSTTFELPGYRVERTLGLSWGLIVRSVGLTKGLTGTVRSLNEIVNARWPHLARLKWPHPLVVCR